MPQRWAPATVASGSQSPSSSRVIYPSTCPVAMCCKVRGISYGKKCDGACDRNLQSAKVITMQKVSKHRKAKSTSCSRALEQALQQFRRGQRLDTVTLFSETGRNSSLAVSRNSTIGLSCVTHWIRSSLCSSNRADKVFPSPALPGGEGIRDTQEKLVNLKKMTAWSVERDLTE